MIDTIEFSNYRIFASTQRIKLAPITIIFGKNNAGKSALLKLPLLIESAFQGQSSEVFTKKVKGVRICDEYRDIVFGKAYKAVNIKLTNTEQDTLDFSFYVDSSQKGQQTFLEHWSLCTKEGNNLYISKQEDESLVDSLKNIYTFKGITPNSGNPEQWVFDTLKKFDTSVNYLGPVRELPLKDYRLHDEPLVSVGSKGEFAYDYLIDDVLNKDGQLLSKVSTWYEKTFDGWKVSIDQTHSPVYYIEMQHGPIKNNILDTGAGIAQSMPVVISVGLQQDENPSINVIEEPETHLHPAAHAELAEYIAREINNNPNKQTIIETHSLNFILRLRLLVAEGNIDPHDIALYYVDFDKDEGSSKLKPVQIDKSGDVSEWPSDVFNESLLEVLKLRTAQMKRK